MNNFKLYYDLEANDYLVRLKMIVKKEWNVIFYIIIYWKTDYVSVTFIYQL